MAAMLYDLTYAAQFEVLRVWISGLDADELSAPSVLAGWTVADLIGHLAGTGSSIAALEPAPEGTDPISIATYVSNYAPAADEIAAVARDTTVGAGPELLDLFGRTNEAAMSNLTALGGSDRVVLARRGPILLSDFLDTRLIELVVHAGDLARSLPDRKPPKVLSGAAWRVVAVMRELLTERAADPVAALAAASTLPVVEFIELATGRRPLPDGLPVALGTALPLF
ncbi:TIGR03083 family protein [Nakamurella panacisegetis]|uniref:TIGR03083 family protein n=1 Tax=Nakamurella panacisegetis TaxID=1090615 RepID=A0A1H0P6U8_9ACTN|nr:maleylpyruvate isomerase N-terminal domain-containing protein [Nakamurella panacisegetis]SDP00674.1 TIGR03083 family protein [Nakamurella panacisegetis]